MLLRCVVSLVVVGSPGLGQAADPAVNVGVVGAMAVPDGSYLGTYGYAAISVGFPTSGIAVVPVLGIEYSPDTSRWGFMGSVVFDVPLSSKIAGDLIVSAASDQSGMRWGDAVLLVGGGVGLSFTSKYVVISPSVCLFGAVNASGWSVTPGLNIAHVF